MRRIPLTLAATAAALPLVLTASAVPATAAGSSLTVTTLNRSGARVTTNVTVTNLTNDSTYSVLSGHRLALPAGRYAVLVDIADQTTTLAARVVTVSGSTAVTEDARWGKPVNVALDATAGNPDYQENLDVRLCAGGFAGGEVEGGGTAGSVFVVPNTSKNLQFAYLADWSTHGYPAHSTGYVVSGQTTGVPVNPSASYRRSGLALVHFQTRAGEESGTDTDLSIQPVPVQNDCQTDLMGQIDQADAPYAVDAYVSPGRWQDRTDIFADHQGQGWDVGGTFLNPFTYVAGRSYWHEFDRAVWGPSWTPPQVWQHSVYFDPGNMITDPLSGRSTGGATTRGTYTLSKGGTVLKRQVLTTYGGMPTFQVPIRSAGWYTLYGRADRYYPGIVRPAGELSPTVTLNMHFYANPAVVGVLPVFLTRFLPVGLDAYNRAAPGSIVSVPMAFDRTSNDPADIPVSRDAVKTVRVWASNDNGRTWHAVYVKHSGTAWTASIRNPGSGAVTLRSQVTDAQGNSSTETIYRAYTIS